jgi:hypothetical protein
MSRLRRLSETPPLDAAEALRRNLLFQLIEVGKRTDLEVRDDSNEVEKLAVAIFKRAIRGEASSLKQIRDMTGTDDHPVLGVEVTA